MDTRRLLRTTSTVFVAAVLLMSGCTSGGEDSDGSEREKEGRTKEAPTSTRSPGGDAEPLKALPAEIPAELKPYYGQKLKWRECGVVGFECTSLTVPLDYEQPAGDEELKLAVSRKKAEGDGKRIGSLMVNPGGPGGSAIEYLQQAAAIGFPGELRERYDLVGMDPRGVARSEPIECLSDREMDSYTRVDQTPDSGKETDKLVDAYKSFAKGCEQRSSGLLGHVSTVEAARDMDVLRAALSDDKLYYYGASYGTYLGATYAGLYPKRTGRLVLDGAMDPSLTARELNVQQAGGFDTAFNAFAEDCVEQSDCPLGNKDPKDAAARLSAFFKKVDAKPLMTGGSRTLTESQATTGVIQSMYAEALWPQLREALAAAMKGDGSGLLALADSYYEREPDGSYGNIMFANPAVNCLDLPAAFSGPEEVEKAVPEFEKASSVFGRGFAWASLNCAYWQQDPTGEPHRITADAAAPMIVVGTTRDPATPYIWAQGLAGQLSTARLLTFEGDGHTAFMGNECIDSTITSYLLDGKAPKDGKRCS
ncbi:alpha/beta hydrolase [Streptomyces sp. N2-109]|uniref:Alpha/beta hydrolase n=1 Tax=Streptomyces gossypii TaxID=2883101 RepID=A0ABT2JPX2_9ACTN|nr:alpha/beta hydrolase [Streptomyces gossypii]MCT2589927.1 alpha/beta hydrolase [Streptomyces gossypii]